VTSYRKPAIAVLSIGAALLVAGVVMVAVDRARGRRRDGTRAEVHRSMMLGSLD
jgi:cytochrome c biogenesis factor